MTAQPSRQFRDCAESLSGICEWEPAGMMLRVANLIETGEKPIVALPFVLGARAATTTTEGNQIATYAVETLERMIEKEGVPKGRAKPKEPKRTPPGRDAEASEIKDWIQRNWKNHWWGTMDCDRCPYGRGRKWGTDHPCDQCPRWQYWIADYRKGRSLGG